MAVNNTSLYSTESVSYQSGSPLFKALIEVTKELQAYISTLKNGERYFEPDSITMRKFHLKYENLIAEHTGLNVTVGYYDHVSISGRLKSDYNAEAQIPFLTPSSVFMSRFAEIMDELDSESYIDELLKHKSKLEGMVDRKKSRVYGDFTKIKGKIVYSKQMLTLLSAEEFSAVMLHETGHIFSAFDLLIRTTMGNMAIIRAAEALTKANDTSSRIKILNNAQSLTGMDDASIRKIAEQEMSFNGYSTLLISSYAITKLRSDSDSFYHDTSSIEFAAEEFEIMHGAGRYALTALDKLYVSEFIKQYNYGLFYKTLTISGFIIGQSIRILITALGMTVAWVLGLFFTALSLALIYFNHLLAVKSQLRLDLNLSASYSTPFVIASRHRGSLIQALKQKDLTKDDRQEILREIEFYDQVLKNEKFSNESSELVFRLLSPAFGRQLKQREKQVLLEELINNSLFSRAEKFDQLLLK